MMIFDFESQKNVAQKRFLKTLERFNLYVDPHDDIRKALDTLHKALEAGMYKGNPQPLHIESLDSTLKSITYKGIFAYLGEDEP